MAIFGERHPIPSHNGHFKGTFTKMEFQIHLLIFLYFQNTHGIVTQFATGCRYYYWIFVDFKPLHMKACKSTLKCVNLRQNSQKGQIFAKKCTSLKKVHYRWKCVISTIMPALFNISMTHKHWISNSIHNPELGSMLTVEKC